MITNRIYLDNAATSWPKPETVYVAVDHAQRYLGAAAGRGSYGQAIEVSQKIERARDAIAKLIHAPHARNIAFTYSCTDSLNLALCGILKPNDHVVTSTAEHNSVLRPLQHLETSAGVTMTRVPCDITGTILPSGIISAITAETRMVVLSQVSNVTGAIQPLDEIGRECRRRGVLFLVDAAQSIGHLPIDIRQLNCDLLAAAGHKGLLGPLGTGFLFYSDSVAQQLQPLRFGGTGSSRSDDRQPTTWPEKFESGNLNVPGIIGLGAGIDYLQSCHGGDSWEHSKLLTEKFLFGLRQLQGVQLHGPVDLAQRLSVFSISIEGFACHDAAMILDQQFSIQARAGLHCAPLLHRTIGTEAVGGTLRLSPGFFNSLNDVERTLAALAELAKA